MPLGKTLPESRSHLPVAPQEVFSALRGPSLVPKTSVPTESPKRFPSRPFCRP